MRKRRIKSVGKKTLQLRKAWNLLKRKDQAAINRELLIKILNAIYMARRRGQKEAWIGLAVELARGELLAKALRAYQSVVYVVEGRFSGNIDARLHQEGQPKLIVYEAHAFGIQAIPTGFMQKLVERLWTEVANRRAAEGARQSWKKKKVAAAA